MRRCCPETVTRARWIPKKMNAYSTIRAIGIGLLTIYVIWDIFKSYPELG
jgi:hypothetical protein